jgi:hypothetical protein
MPVEVRHDGRRWFCDWAAREVVADLVPQYRTWSTPATIFNRNVAQFSVR